MNATEFWNKVRAGEIKPGDSVDLVRTTRIKVDNIGPEWESDELPYLSEWESSDDLVVSDGSHGIYESTKKFDDEDEIEFIVISSSGENI